MQYWQDKVILITGASSGFGFALAKQFASQKANIICVARDQSKLDKACEQLKKQHQQIQPFAADVTSKEDVESLFQFVIEKYGTLDLLINNAGISARGKVEETSLADFTKMYQLNVEAVIRCTQQAIPLLRKSKGHLVNIGSLASKSAAKYLGPYATTKFALAGLTHQLRLELAEDGIHVMLVCPGPMTRDDAGQRYNDQVSDLPEEVKKPGAGVSVKLIDPDELASEVLIACAKRKAELVKPAKAKLLFAIAQLSPSWGDWILRQFSSRAD